MVMKNIFIIVGLFCCVGISKGEAAWTNSGIYSSKGGALMVPFENKSAGQMILSNTKVLSLVNSGKVSCENCLFLKEVLNEGVLLAEKTKFQDTLSISGGQTVLTSCELTDIKINDQDAIPLIELSGNTHVLGSIVFEAGRGKLFISSSTIIEGSIIGGEFVIKESE